MASVTPEGSTAQSYEPPCNTQFSVFLDNRVGRLLDLVEVFEGQALHVVGLSVMDATDHAVVRVVTSRAELARRLLQRHNFAFSEVEVLVVELLPGQTLTKLCKSLVQAELSICYAYPLLGRGHGGSLVALHTDDQVLAGQILRKKMFLLLAENDLGDNATPGSAGYPEPPGPSEPGSRGPSGSPPAAAGPQSPSI
jgi:hypothetical protein